MKNTERLVRINQIVGRDGVLPISKSHWWKGVKEGIYPQSIKLSPQVSAWKWSEIESLMENGISDGGKNDYL